MERLEQPAVRWSVCLLLLCCGGAHAQAVFRDDERLESDRPEAWAMHRATGATVMTGFGATPRLASGQWQASLELGHVPRLTTSGQRVGFRGTKHEDLNKSPVFGRLRLLAGLPRGWVLEIGYTPPLEIDGARADDLVTAAIGRRLFDGDRLVLSVRAFGQHGGIRGDITCPAALAGIEDGQRNPYGCQAPSDDRVTLDHHGVDVTAAWSAGTWTWHAGAGAVRSEAQVQVDALTFDVRDRSRLVARDVLPFFALGAERELGARWSLAVELLHVPLTVRRGADADREREDLASLRMALRYRAR